MLLGAAGTGHAQTVQSNGAVKQLGGGFSELGAIAVDSSGNVYVGSQHGGVSKIPPGCTSSSCVTTLLSSSVDESSGAIAVDGSGDVFVSGLGGYVAGKFPAGCATTSCVVYLGGYGTIGGAAGIAVDGNGNLYVAASGAVKTMSTGCLNSSCVATLGGGFSSPFGVAVDGSGNVYVTDASTNLLKKMSAGCLGASCVTTLSGGFTSLRGVAVDGSGNVYVSDLSTGTVKEMPAGCASSSCVATLAGGFDFSTTSIAVDGGGNVYAAASNDKVYEILPSNNSGSGSGGSSTPVSLASYFGNFGSVPVSTSTPATLTFPFTFLTGGSIAAPAVLTMGATGLDYTDAGTGTCTTNGTSHVYAVGATCTVTVNFSPKAPGPRNGGIQIKSNSGTVLSTVYITGTGTGPQLIYSPNSTIGLGGGFSGPIGVALDGSGNVYVADTGHSAVKEMAAGCASSGCVTTQGGSFIGPESVAVDGTGNIYVADTGNGAVREMPAACASSSCVTTAGGGFSHPLSVAVDGSGNIYIVDNNSVKKMAAGCANSSCVTVLGGGFSDPFGVAVDGSGNVYIADNGNVAVKEMPAGCASSGCVTAIGGGFNSPFGIAVDGSGNIYVTDSGAVKELPAGCASSSCVATLASGFTSAGVVVDGSGNVYAVDDISNGAVLEIVRAALPTVTFATATKDGSTDTTDGTQTVTLTNDGNLPLVFAIPGSATNPAVGPDFTFTPIGGSACPSLTSSTSAQGILAVNASCTLPITFTPIAGSSGAVTESLTLTDNNLNNGNGTLAPTATATQTIVLKGTAISGPTATQAIASTTLTAGQVATSFIPVTGSGGTAPLSYAVSPALPAGLSMASGTGLIGGTPTVASTAATYTVTVTDANSLTATATFSLTVAAATPTVSVSSVAVGSQATAGVPVLATESGPAGTANGSVVTFGVNSPATGSFSPATCTIANGSCTTTYIPTGTLAYGAYTNGITASFAAAGNYAAASASNTLIVTLIPGESVLVNFTGTSGAAPGANPDRIRLIQASDGNFYGTTLYGGANNLGTVFKVNPAGAYTPLHSFSNATTDGETPDASLVQGTDGSFYGTTIAGGANGFGTVFKITSAGAFSLLHSFSSGTTDGATPYSSLVQGADGNFYGTTVNGGASGYGTVFKITSTGTLTLLHSFSNGDGNGPQGGLVQGADGNFYGTTVNGGANNAGTAFKITSTGAYTLLHSFSTSPVDGEGPFSGLVQGADGNFYGTTTGGGANSYGTVFKITSAGVFTLLHSFSGTATDGATSYSGLVQGTGGNFFGTTLYGGANNDGTVFEITSTGTFALLYSFSSAATDGYVVPGGLVQGSDGGFYGTTIDGGAYDYGTVFKLVSASSTSGPVALSVPTSVTAGSGFTLSYSVANAYSATLQQCFATNNAGDTTGWTGIFTGSPTAANVNLTAPSTAGSYTYTLTCGGMESSSVTLTVTVPTVAATPTFSPAAGTYGSAQSVTIGSTTPGASIYYTTNGTTPTTGSTLYNGAITVSSSETIQAIAVASGYSASPVASASYTISPPPVASLSASTLWVTTCTDSIYRFDGFTGAAKDVLNAPNGACGITQTGGNLYTLGGEYGTLNEFSPAGLLVSTVVSSVSSSAYDASRIAAGPDGNLYITLANANEVVRYTTSGSSLGVFASGSTSGTYHSLAGMTFSQNAFYVADFQGEKILQYPLTGGTPTAVPVACTFQFDSLLFAPNGDLLVTNGCGPIYDVTASATFATWATGSARGLHLGPDGSLYVANQDEGAIYRLAPQTGSTPAVFASGEGLTNPIDFQFVVESNISFPSQNLNTSSSVLSGLLTNTGSSALSIASIAIGGTNAADFQQSNSCGSSLAAGAVCTIAVTFTPSATGSRSAALTIADNSSGVAGSTQTLTLSGTGVQPLLAATPTFSPAGGTYTSAQSVVIGTATPGAAIYYTTDGTTPTTGSTLYSGAIAVPASETLEAIAVAAGYSNSAVATAVYTIIPAAGTLIEPVGTASAPQTAVVLFTSNSTPRAIQVVTQGATGLDFSFASGGTCAIGTAYTSGQSCTVNYIFTPKYPGSRSGAVILSGGSSVPIATAYISGTGTGAHAVFQPGTQSAIGSGLYFPQGVAVDAAGNVYAVDSYNNRVLKVPPTDSTCSTPADCTTVASGLSTPWGVAVDGAGNVYIADYSANRVLRETPSSGSYTQTVIADSGVDGLSFPSGVSVDEGGNVYIADTGNSRILLETPSGGTYAQSVIGSGLSSPRGVAVDGSGNVYIADQANSRVVKETLSGGNYVQSSIGTGWSAPFGVATDGLGNVYVADQNYSSVVTETLSGGNYVQSTIGSGLNELRGLAVDGSGNVYVADSGNNRVVKIDVADAPALTFASTQAGAISSDSPQTLTLENLGNAALTFPIPAGGNNPAISTNFTLNSTGAAACPLTASGASSPGSLAAGTSCSLPVSFAPVAVGSISGSLVLADNSLNLSNATQSISLSGTGTAAVPTVSLSAVTVPAGSIAAVTITATESGAAGAVTGGVVSFSIVSPVTGSFSPATCTLSSSGSCTTTYIPSGTLAKGAYSNGIQAGFAANNAYAAATAYSTLTVTPATPAVSISAVAAPFGSTAGVTVTATESGPAGTAAGSVVAFSVVSPATGSFSPATCIISNGSCTTSYIPTGSLAPNTYANDIQASFTASANYSAATAASTLTISSGIVETVLLSFNNGTNDAPTPGNLIQGSDGNFYGTADHDGANQQGTVYKVTPSGTYTLLHSFNGSDGSYSNASLVEGSDGNFYGTAESTVYRITSAGTFTLLHTFQGEPNDGGQNASNLVQGSDGNFYGTTASGGANNDGTVFKITPAGAVTLLHSFSGPDGIYPSAGLVQGSDGNFYGTAGEGGASNYGTVFKISSTGTYTLLHSFSGTDGQYPAGNLVQGSDGNFYGDTYVGGANGDGAAFKISSTGAFTLLYSFSGATSNGPFGPYSGLVAGSDGNLYGTTIGEGANNAGMVFQISPTGSFTQLYSFSGTAPDGDGPSVGLLQGADGSFYGTTRYGGANGAGTIFKIASVPAQAGPVALSVPSSVNAGATFALTYSVANAYSETLQQCFATNTAGDTTGWTGVQTAATTATIANLTAPVASGAYTYTLTCGGMESNSVTLNVAAVGASPTASVSAISVPAGSTAGVTVTATESGSAGVTTGGVVTFSVVTPATGSFSPSTCTLNSAGTCTTTYTPTGSLSAGTYIHGIEASFAAINVYSAATATSTLSVSPTAPTVTVSAVMIPAGSAARVTVTATESGPAGAASGSVVTFSVASPATGSFSPATCTIISLGSCTTSYIPTGSLATPIYPTIQASFTASGNYTAATAASALEVDAESVLLNFSSSTGTGPAFGSLIQASDGNFYGTTANGGTNGGGTAYKVSPSGTFTLLHSFSSATDGSTPFGGLVEGTDGNFYGAAHSGGANGLGTIFEMNPSGAVTVLHSFSGTDGSYPWGAPVQGTDGNFYGTTNRGGSGNIPDGVIYKISSSGTFTLLHTFVPSTDGGIPVGSLVQGTDGNFYGTTQSTVFRISPSGTFTALHTFSGSDGSGSWAGLSQGADGNFYGVNPSGGANSGGTVFKISSSGTFTVLHSFSGPEGSGPYSAPVQGTDGNFYGATSAGGVYGDGTLFRISPSGTFTLLHSFSIPTADALAPFAGLVQGADGNFYGFAQGGGANADGAIFKFTSNPTLAGPVALSVPSSVNAGASFALTYSVANATSATLQQCFATNTAGDTTGWVGILTASPTAANANLIAPSAAGSYTYTLTCGGVESSSVTLNVASLTPAATPAFSPVAGTYTSAQSVMIASTTPGASIYYTTNGTTPTTSSTPYTGAIAVGASETIQAIAVANGYANSAVGTAAYVINLQAATPAFSPGGGTYTSPQVVTIASATAGATIYYTTDGSTPTTASLVYTVPLALTSSETINAIAVASGHTNSAVGSAAYVINGVVGIISTYAGNGTAGYSGDGGAATSAGLNSAWSTAVDSSGNLYIADGSNNRVRMVTPAGVISTVAGNGTAGYSGDGGMATSAEMYEPTGVALDSAGNLYIAEFVNSRIRKVTPAGVISTVAGNGGSYYSGDGGLAINAGIDSPRSVAVDSQGNLYITNENANRIRKVTPSGVISTVAGNGTAGFSGDEGPATSAELNGPFSVAVDSADNLYIADYHNNVIRKVTSEGTISTIAGNGSTTNGGYGGDGGPAINAELNEPTGVAVDSSGNVYIADYNNQRVRKVTPLGQISTVAGNGTPGYSGDGAAATGAKMEYPNTVAVDNSGNFYISDYGNNRIRKVTYETLPAPFGYLDEAADSLTGSANVSQSDSLLVSGWAADAIDGSPLSNVKIYIDGSSIGTPTLGIARPDVAAVYGNSAYTDSGYQLLYSAASLSVGAHSVTAIAIDSNGVSATFGPVAIAVTPPPLPPPFGYLDQAADSVTGSTTVSQSDSLLVSGWAADVTDGAPLSNVKVYVDGTLFGAPTLGIARADVAAAYSNSVYTNSGYQLLHSAASLSVGTHAVTVVAIDSGGRSTAFGPIAITVTPPPLPPPFGYLDQAADSLTGSATVSQSDSLLVRGWVADATDGAPLSNVKVYVDGTSIGTPTLGLARADVAAAYGNSAYTNSGFQLLQSAASLSVGTHSVTVIAIDSGSRSTTFGPIAITVTPPPLPPPFGYLDQAADSLTGSATVSQSDSLLVRGWVADATDGAPLSNVKVYVDGTSIGTPTLGLARADVASAYGNSAYTNSGFQLLQSAASLSVGTHSVTVVAIDSGARSTTFGPLSVTVAAH